MMPMNSLAQRFGSAPMTGQQPGIMAPGMPQMAPRPQMPVQALPQPNFLARPQLAPAMAMPPGQIPQNAMRARFGM